MGKGEFTILEKYNHGYSIIYNSENNNELPQFRQEICKMATPNIERII